MPVTQFVHVAIANALFLGSPTTFAHSGAYVGLFTSDPGFLGDQSGEVAAQQALDLPGTSGHFAETPDINLLDADTAHIVQSVGLWTVGAVSGDQSNFGPSSLKVSAGVSTAVTPVTDAAFFRVSVFSVAGDTFDLNGDTGTTVPAGVWTVVKTAGNAGTYTLSAVGSADYYVDQSIVQTTDSTFVPSLRIVGDLEMEADVQLDNYLLDFQTILSTMGTASIFEGYRLWLLEGGGPTFDGVRIAHGSGVSDRDVQIVPSPALIDGRRYLLRAEVDSIGPGDSELFVDGVTQGTEGFLAGSAQPSVDASLRIGARRHDDEFVTGKISWVKVRDGIGGPVVAHFDANAFAVGDSDTDTAVIQGRTWTLHGGASSILAGYTRIQPVWSSGGDSRTVTDISFPVATIDWGTVTHVGILDSMAGGNMLAYEPTAGPIVITTDDQIDLKNGDFTVDVTFLNEGSGINTQRTGTVYRRDRFLDVIIDGGILAAEPGSWVGLAWGDGQAFSEVDTRDVPEYRRYKVDWAMTSTDPVTLTNTNVIAWTAERAPGTPAVPGWLEALRTVQLTQDPIGVHAEVTNPDSLLFTEWHTEFGKASPTVRDVMRLPVGSMTIVF